MYSSGPQLNPAKYLYSPKVLVVNFFISSTTPKKTSLPPKKTSPLMSLLRLPSTNTRNNNRLARARGSFTPATAPVQCPRGADLPRGQACSQGRGQGLLLLHQGHQLPLPTERGAALLRPRPPVACRAWWRCALQACGHSNEQSRRRCQHCSAWRPR